MKKDFIPDHKSLGDDFDSKANKVKREAYKANHTKEQKIEVYTKWKECMKEISSNVPFFEYFENHFEWHRKSCVITKTNWTKENKELVCSSHPPLENITIKYQGFELVATPFRKPSSEDKLVKQDIEQNNYNNQCLDVIGKQLDRIEDKLEAKAIPQLGNLVKQPIQSLEKPLVKLPITRQTNLRSKNKTALEIVNQKLEELVKKEPTTSSTSKDPRLNTLDIHTASSSSSNNKTSTEFEKEIEKLENQFQ